MKLSAWRLFSAAAAPPHSAPAAWQSCARRPVPAASKVCPYQKQVTLHSQARRRA